MGSFWLLLLDYKSFVRLTKKYYHFEEVVLAANISDVPLAGGHTGQDYAECLRVFMFIYQSMDLL